MSAIKVNGDLGDFLAPQMRNEVICRMGARDMLLAKVAVYTHFDRICSRLDVFGVFPVRDLETGSGKQSFGSLTAS
jgi:hypothetical protein